jgi:serine/threonine-protein kinase
MSTPAADRNLLFGILALQMDFINQESLVAAMNAWVLDKRQSLGKVLLHQGRLTADLVQLLEALVNKHVQVHQGDPQQSLAALSSASSIRQQLSHIADPNLQASLAWITAEPNPQREATIGYEAARPAAPGARYRILRPHARGGLGEVFVAEDVELRREVALKEIRKEHAGDQNSRGRFVLEAEITGGLEHPGIVPVYGLGTSEDGRPYYAMRFIKGDNLKEAIERFHKAEGLRRHPGERNVAFRELLGRFVDVCNAIAYAHSRGVLHRDLKPGNIMLGKYGETLVVDWGLAKAVGRPDALAGLGEVTLHPGSADSDRPSTRLGTAIGTPAFMSPEQAAGKLDQLSPASDVYGLGATLYALLTGRAPVAGDTPEILRRVQQGELTPPRQVKSGVPLALEAICRKAMAQRPEDRYRTPLELAEEIEHWLADEPVAAYRDPWPARGGRWARRHRTLVTGLAAAALVAVVSLTVATVLLSAANQREVEARELAEHNGEDARRKGDEAQANFLLAKKHSEHAERESARAKANFQLARDAVEEYCTKVSNDLRLKEKDLEELRKDLLQSAVKFHQKFVQQHRDDPALRADLGRAYFELSQLLWDTNDMAGAIDVARQAVAIYEQLAQAEAGKGTYALPLARALVRSGMALDQATRHTESQKAYTRALEILEANRHQPGKSLDWRRAYLQTSRQLGYVLSDRMGAEAQAIAVLRKAAAFVDGEGKAKSSAPRDVLDQAEVFAQLGSILANAGKKQEGKTWCDRAMQTVEPLTAGKDVANALPASESASSALASLSSMYTYVDRTYFKMKELSKSLHASRQAVRCDQELMRLHPGVTRYQQWLATDLNDVARTLNTMGRKPEALVLFKESLKIKEDLVRRHPEVPDFQANLARSLHVLASETNDLAQARAYQERSESLLKEVTTRNPRIDTFQKTYASSIHVRALLRRRAGQLLEAIAALDQAIEVMAELVRTTDTAEHRNMLRSWCLEQTGLCLSANQPVPAAAAFRKALALNPTGTAVIFGYSAQLLNMGRPADAAPGFARVLALKPNLAAAQCNLGHCLVQQGRFVEGRAALLRGHELGLKTPGWRYLSAEWVRNADQLIQLDNRLTAIRAGLARPTGSKEELQLALFCHYRKNLYGPAVQFYAAAFAGTPALAENPVQGYRTQAARAAAQAAAGQGQDADKLNVADRSKLRRQALDWLQADLQRLAQTTATYQRGDKTVAQKPASFLDKLSGQAQKPGPTDILRVCDRLQRWQTTPDLASLRDDKALARLPDAELKDWRKLWDSVHALDKQAHTCFTEKHLAGTLTAQKQEQMHEVRLQAGTTYVFDLESTAFDTALRLEDDRGQKLDENNDIEPKVNLNSRLIFTPHKDGLYRLVATSFGRQGTGAFVLHIRSFPAPQAQPPEAKSPDQAKKAPGVPRRRRVSTGTADQQ